MDISATTAIAIFAPRLLAVPSVPETTEPLAMVALPSIESEAVDWRDAYNRLKAEYQTQKEQWAAEDKESAIEETRLRETLKHKCEELEETKGQLKESLSKLEKLQEESKGWAAAVGRRDGKLEAADTAHRSQQEKHTDHQWASSKKGRWWHS